MKHSTPTSPETARAARHAPRETTWQLTRRGFFCSAAICLSACANTPWYMLPADSPTWPVEVPLEKLGEQGHLAIGNRGANPPLLLSKTDDGFRAVELTCTHRGCELRVRRKLLACPCHGARFEFTGEVLQGPAERPLKSYPVTKTDRGSVLIHAAQDTPDS